MNKETKKLLALIYWDLDCIDYKKLDEDGRYHYKLAFANLKQLMKDNKIKEHGYSN